MKLDEVTGINDRYQTGLWATSSPGSCSVFVKEREYFSTFFSSQISP
jgi:hypothetical protein